jgi:hypothetical protein
MKIFSVKNGMIKLWFLTKQLKNTSRHFKDILQPEAQYYQPAYRLVRIEQDETGDYFVVIQVIGKSLSYKIKPETLLADDKFVNLFSPVDIRNLTYLGYLGINAPKYKILAKKLSENEGQILFAIHKKGEKGHKIVTATEISTNDEILRGLSQQDAHMVGFTTATEQTLAEKQQKDDLIRQLEQKHQNKDQKL